MQNFQERSDRQINGLKWVVQEIWGTVIRLVLYETQEGKGAGNDGSTWVMRLEIHELEFLCG